MPGSISGADGAGHDQWFHGDLVAENLLVSEGRLSGVLDFGAVSVGDPTIDLHGAWEILDASARAVFAHALGVGEAECLRGRAWALGIALNGLSYYWTTMPGRRDDRIAMARNVLDSDAASTGIVMDVRDRDRTQAGIASRGRSVARAVDTRPKRSRLPKCDVSHYSSADGNARDGARRDLHG